MFLINVVHVNINYVKCCYKFYNSANSSIIGLNKSDNSYFVIHHGLYPEKFI